MKRLAHLIFACIFTCTLILSPILAQAKGLIRDAELELALKNIAKPVIQAAGLSSNRIRILVLNDNARNALVDDSRPIFLHSGLIRRRKRPEALQAVIAHEIAHIANGHLTRRAGNLRVANQITAIGFALAIAAAASGEGDAALGLATGTASSAQRVFFAHTRSEESSADQSGIRYLRRAGIDPAAMTDVLDLFRGQEALRSNRQDPYARTHPLTRDRLRAVKGYVAAAKSKPSEPSKTDAYWFARMNAKLTSFLGNPRTTLRNKASKGDGEIATLRRAIAYHKTPNLKKAMAETNRLISMRPRDPFYHELKGQILLESRNFGAAVKSYKTAMSLAPREPLIQAGLGKAYLALNTNSGYQSALKTLTQARSRDPGDPRMLRDLALAHAKIGQNAMASVATAERYAVLGRFKDATLHAKRAMNALPQGSGGWLRANDVAQTAKSAAKRKKKR
jgi:predicted Zn-dependent protease